MQNRTHHLEWQRLIFGEDFVKFLVTEFDVGL